MHFIRMKTSREWEYSSSSNVMLFVCSITRMPKTIKCRFYFFALPKEWTEKQKNDKFNLPMKSRQPCCDQFNVDNFFVQHTPAVFIDIKNNFSAFQHVHCPWIMYIIVFNIRTYQPTVQPITKYRIFPLQHKKRWNDF